MGNEWRERERWLSRRYFSNNIPPLSLLPQCIRESTILLHQGVISSAMLTDSS